MKDFFRSMPIWVIWVILGLAGIIMLAYFWYDLVDLFFNQGKDEPSGELLKIVLTILGGILVFMTYRATMRRAKAAEETAANQLLEVKAHREENEIQRFNQAIEQLGHQEASVRMGGIYTLHSIAKESDDSFREIICNIFCSYVRDRSRKLVKLTPDPKTGKTIEVFEPITVDIQAVCEILFSVSTSDLYKDYPKLLTGANLKEVHLPKCILTKVQFYRVNLDSAVLVNAHLEEAVLIEANLTNARLNGAHLDSAFLWNANLHGANLLGTKMKGTNLRSANLQGAFGLGLDQLLSCSSLKLTEYIPQHFYDELIIKRPELF